MRVHIGYAHVVPLVCCLMFSISAWSGTPVATVTPVEVPGTTAFSATVLDLDRARYLEQEFYVSGIANRYRISGPLDTAQVIDSGYPYISRILVRRPARAKNFNGTVIVEWYNVTGGQDSDIVFAAIHDHLLREGYAFVAVSAQLVGVNTLRTWSPARYGSLNITASNVDPATGGQIDARGDVLSWDIYGQVGAALRTGAGLGGLKPKRVIAAGESQSAARLTAYYNSIQPLHRVYDAFLTYDRMGPLRSDIGVKSVSIGTEFLGGISAPPADTDYSRWWEVAGASHLSTEDLEYIDPVVKRDGIFRDASGNPLSLTELLQLPPGCQYNSPFSRVPSGHALDMGLEQLIAWIIKDRPPVKVPRFSRDATGKLVRNTEGRVSGGLRLPEYEAPRAENSGVNSGPGFCVLAGHHLDFSEDQLCDRYDSHGGYVKKVLETAHRAERADVLLPADALSSVIDAVKFRFSCRGDD
jgi:alpha/beta hydrolase family protein